MVPMSVEELAICLCLSPKGVEEAWSKGALKKSFFCYERLSTSTAQTTIFDAIRFSIDLHAPDLLLESEADEWVDLLAMAGEQFDWFALSIEDRTLALYHSAMYEGLAENIRNDQIKISAALVARQAWYLFLCDLVDDGYLVLPKIYPKWEPLDICFEDGKWNVV